MRNSEHLIFNKKGLQPISMTCGTGSLFFRVGRLQSLGLRPWACKLAGTVEQTEGINFSIKEKKKNKIPACQTR